MVKLDPQSQGVLQFVVGAAALCVIGLTHAFAWEAFKLDEERKWHHSLLSNLFMICLMVECYWFGGLVLVSIESLR